MMPLYTINSGGKYRTVSRTFTDKVPLVAAHGYARIRVVYRVYAHPYTRGRDTPVNGHARRMCVKRKEGTTEERLERRTGRRGKEEEEHKTGGK